MGLWKGVAMNDDSNLSVTIDNEKMIVKNESSGEIMWLKKDHGQHYISKDNGETWIWIPHIVEKICPHCHGTGKVYV